jgi:hypothetical protein
MYEKRVIDNLISKIYYLMEQEGKEYLEISSEELGYLCTCGSSFSINAYKKGNEMLWQSNCENCLQRHQEIYKPWRGYWKEHCEFGRKYSFCEEHLVSIPFLPIKKLDKIILQLECGSIVLSFSNAEKRKEFLNVDLSPVKGFTLYYPFSYAKKLGSIVENIELVKITIEPIEPTAYDLLISDPEIERNLQVHFF